MKRIFVLSLLVHFALATTAQDFVYDKPVANVKATIKILEDKETAVIVPDNNATMRYISMQLPAEYKRDGLKVTFTGVEGKIPPNVRMMGKPLKITSICVSKSEAKKYKLKKRKYVFS